MSDGRDDINRINGTSIDPQKCGQHDADISNLKASDERQWALLEKIQDRLPVWATFAFGVLTLLIGWLLNS
jgi:hypothetical protein